MRHGWLALVGLALSIPVLVGSLRGSYSLEAAAARLGILVAALVVVDKMVLPLGRLALALLYEGPGGPADQEVREP